MIATRDISSVAADLLLRLSFRGSTSRELLGPRDFTMQEATKIVGRSIGNEALPYVQFSYEDAEKAMLEIGFSQSAAKTFVELYQGLNDGIFTPTEMRSARTTTPTSFEKFATEEFSIAYGS